MFTRSPSRLSRTATATVAVAALGLTGCATDAASPADAVDARFAQGTTIAVTIEADPAGLSDATEAAELQDMLDVVGDDPVITVGMGADGAVSSFALMDVVEVRRAGNDVYLRVDWDRLATLGDAPLQQDPRATLEQLAASVEGAQDVAAALAAGEWIGITDVSDSAQDLLEGMLGGMGAMGSTEGAAPTELPGMTSGDDEELQALLQEHDLDSLSAFTSTYVTAEGSNPWELTVDGAAVQAALEDIREAADDAGLAADMAQLDEDLPATITGFTLTAQDGVATELRMDPDQVAASMGDSGLDPDDLADLADADAQVVFTMTDLGDNGEVPADATTIAMADLVALLGQG